MMHVRPWRIVRPKLVLRIAAANTAVLFEGDSAEVLKSQPDHSVDSVVTDPPYALISTLKRFANSPRSEAAMPTAGPYARASRGFMGEKWDNGDTAHAVEFWREVYRVLKPGGFVLAFGGTRTYHRLACAIEDAGFEVRDMVQWLYGSGFPKSHNHGEGRGTALKPACEPICMARKPLSENTVAANLLRWGTGAINIDGCRVGTSDIAEIGSPSWGGPMKRLSAVPGQAGKLVARTAPNNTGRWPANVVTDGSDEVVAMFPRAPRQIADVKHADGELKTSNVYGKMAREHDVAKLAAIATEFPELEVTAVLNGRLGEASAERRYSENGSTDFAALPGQRRKDSGSAARFFYQAKATKKDRAGSKHPTVKPVALMRYLCRLVTPRGGIVLDPFAGTGTTGEACHLEGFSVIMIEREARFVADIRARYAGLKLELS